VSSGKPNGVRYEYYDTRLTPGSLPSVLSLASDATTATSLSSARGPLRSSLKKPRATEEAVDSAFGIQNPGFSGTSPTLSRNGSVKKVRIQTHSTAV
jgi:hypothetical protein